MKRKDIFQRSGRGKLTRLDIEGWPCDCSGSGGGSGATLLSGSWMNNDITGNPVYVQLFSDGTTTVLDGPGGSAVSPYTLSPLQSLDMAIQADWMKDSDTNIPVWAVTNADDSVTYYDKPGGTVITPTNIQPYCCEDNTTCLPIGEEVAITLAANTDTIITHTIPSTHTIMHVQVYDSNNDLVVMSVKNDNNVITLNSTIAADYTVYIIAVNLDCEGGVATTSETFTFDQHFDNLTGGQSVFNVAASSVPTVKVISVVLGGVPLPNAADTPTVSGIVNNYTYAIVGNNIEVTIRDSSGAAFAPGTAGSPNWVKISGFATT